VTKRKMKKKKEDGGKKAEYGKRKGAYLRKRGTLFPSLME